MAKDPLSLAVDAERALEGLATALASSGADDQTVASVTQMADMCRKIVGVLGQGQHATGDLEPAGQSPASIDEATAALHNDMQAAARDR